MSTIAVVDDNPVARHWVTACLTRGGHEIREIQPSCLFRVLESLHNDPPDLLVTDLMMPGCPGQTLIRACREDPHLQELKILLLTAHGDLELPHFLQAMGRTHYLTKPLPPPVLVECVDHFLTGNLEIDPGWSLACNGVVAVVDDSRLSRVYNSACLSKGGFKPIQIEPTDLVETARAIEEARPDLTLVDFLMPHFRGDALIQAIRARGRLEGMPFIMVTAHRGEELQALRDSVQGVEILYKPVFPEVLVAKVRDLLGVQ